MVGSAVYSVVITLLQTTSFWGPSDKVAGKSLEELGERAQRASHEISDTLVSDAVSSTALSANTGKVTVASSRLEICAVSETFVVGTSIMLVSYSESSVGVAFCSA